MRSAKIRIVSSLLFDFLGLNDMEAQVENVNVTENGVMEFFVSGFDYRLPDKEDYPECIIEFSKIVSKIEEV
jgi:hypothetical protein